jgi:NAD(P)H-quinone oxidoreductase subunit 5
LHAAGVALGISGLLTALGIAGFDAGLHAARIPSQALVVAELVRVDPVTLVMLNLVSFIAVVIVRYSRSYLQGEAGQDRYARALMLALAAVTSLVLSNNLIGIALSWMVTSLALHQLLTFYRDRKPALIAAHKKFLLSRLADVCMLGAVALMGNAIGSLNLDRIAQWAQAQESLPISLQVAAVLLVLAASLKSAQLPFHGWLTQVMEAPTPVSALLHAGVVNIGGFVMIRLAPFMAKAPLAQTLLVCIGTTTAVVAALVMTTRVSIKVALAWSTCAQMGFMLAQCGLGAWHLALLHLVAHSLYKAYAFLGAGNTVENWRVRSVSPVAQPASVARRLLVSAGIVGAVGASIAAWTHARGLEDPTILPLALLLALSLSPLLVRSTDGGVSSAAFAFVRAASVAALYFGGHALASRVLGPATTSAPLGWVVLLLGFVTLFVLDTVLQARPGGRVAKALRPWLFAGLYLDELFTRATFRLWAPRLGPKIVRAAALRMTPTLEA